MEGLPSMNSGQQSSLVGSRVVGSGQFLKNLFLQNGPSKNPTVRKKEGDL